MPWAVTSEASAKSKAVLLRRVFIACGAREARRTSLTRTEIPGREPGAANPLQQGHGPT